MIGSSIRGKKSIRWISLKAHFSKLILFPFLSKTEKCHIPDITFSCVQEQVLELLQDLFFPYLFFIPTDLVDMAAGIEAVLFVCIVVILG